MEWVEEAKVKDNDEKEKEYELAVVCFFMALSTSTN